MANARTCQAEVLEAHLKDTENMYVNRCWKKKKPNLLSRLKFAFNVK